MKKKRRIRCAVLAVMLVFSQVIPLQVSTFASDADSIQQSIDELQEAQEELQEQIDSMEGEQSSIEDALEDTKEQVSELEAEQAAIEDNIEELDTQLGEAVKELSDIEQQEESKQAEIEVVNEALAEAEAEQQVQYENMKLRIRYMYEQGTQSYLTVLLSAESTADLLTRAEYITNIYRYDRQMLLKYEEAKAEVEKQKTILAQEYAALEALRTQAEEKQASIESLLADKNEELEEYAEKIAATQALADEYQAKLDEAESLIAELEAAAEENSAQQDEAIAALTALLADADEEETTDVEAAAASAVLESLAATEQAKLDAEGYDIIVDPDSLFVWPCPSSTTITSDYGYRIHPIYGDYRMHNGIDISASMGSAIIAAYQGTVIGAGYDSSMGNYVMIDHGSGLVTVYMHASYLCVSVGDTVETGALIALVGATGDATGPHLHFSVRLNGTYVSPWNYVSY